MYGFWGVLEDGIQLGARARARDRDRIRYSTLSSIDEITIFIIIISIN